ncbi:hypothetical protein [Sphingomonas sp.]|uniref:hypothetical protein n=1 Tax=Sphingomonas sp. TaxID=28214 RepID=UPI0038AFF1EF
MDKFPSVAMTAAMIAAFVLLGGGLSLVRRGQTRVRGALMIVAALVIVTNVMIWTV